MFIPDQRLHDDVRGFNAAAPQMKPRRIRHQRWLVFLLNMISWSLIPDIVSGNAVTALYRTEIWTTTSQEPAFIDGDVRLMDGDTPSISRGRVEVFYQGNWGTICDRDWGINEANVVCRQLGYLQAIKSEKHSKFGNSGDHVDILLDHVYCHGKETMLAECEHGRWGKYHCTHNDEAGLVCDETEPVTLSVGKIAGIAVFCLTCVGYLCLACAKNTRKNGSNRARRARLTSDFVVPRCSRSSHHTCDERCTQSRTDAPPSSAAVTSSQRPPPAGGLPSDSALDGGDQQQLPREDPLPSYDELTDLPPDLPLELPPTYAFVIAAAAVAAEADDINDASFSGSSGESFRCEYSNIMDNEVNGEMNRGH